MIAAGLLVTGDDIPVSFDRFRERVIFPIADFRGRIVGFGGRALAADVPAKYLNSPETDLFHKGSLLYNGAEARKAAHDAGTVIAVEGYVDVDPDGRRRLRPHRRAARHGADRAAAADPLADGRRADPLLRRRQGRHPRRPARRRPGAAAPRAGQEPPLRASPRRPGPRRPHPLARAAQAMAAVHRRRPAAGRPALVARDRGRRLRYARAPRGAGGPPPRDRPRRSATKASAATTAGVHGAGRGVLSGAGADRANSEWRSANSEKGRREPGFDASTRSSLFATRSGSQQIPISDRLKRSADRSSARRGMPLREVVLVMTMVNHPDLIHAHLDEFAHLEFSHARPRRDLQRPCSNRRRRGGRRGGDAPRQSLGSGRFAPLLRAARQQIAARGYWPAIMASASDRDAEQGWLQALTLHRRQRTLHKDLKDAEAALAIDPSEANFARLVDIQSQLANTEGTEALIEGFGASVGRGAASEERI